MSDKATLGCTKLGKVLKSPFQKGQLNFLVIYGLSYGLKYIAESDVHMNIYIHICYVYMECSTCCKSLLNAALFLPGYQ